MKKIVYKLPQDFINRIEIFFPAHAVRILNALTQPSATTFRINRIKTDAMQWKKYMIQEHIHALQVSWLPDAFVLKNMSQRELQEKSAYKEGWIYLQNISSMVPVFILNPQPGEHILDVCAAPGSKTTQMASRTNNEAEIVAIEKIKPRFFRLQANIKAQGATSVQCLLGDANAVLRRFPNHFDTVLLDAPCSSEGLFRAINERSFAYWSLRKVKEMRRKQKRLISATWHALKKGGRLLYSTCTFSPDENEDIIDWLIKKYSDEVTVEDIRLPFSNYIAGLSTAGDKTFDERLRKTRRILPTETMEGFFIALLRKK